MQTESISNKLTNISAIFLLTCMLFLALSSMAGDSLTMDELAHLPAGYSYLTRKDMRLNPEHPPLLKDLATLPLLFFKDIKFPDQVKSWTEDVNGQWGFGHQLLYESGNPAQRMIFWARIPMILILILLGFYVFKWAKELWGNKTALLALFLFSFSPTLLAHGRLVTTDVGAAAGIFIATFYFLEFLKKPFLKNLILASIALSLALLAKFTTFLLIPFFGFLTLIWILVEKQGPLLKKFRVWGLRLMVILILTLFGIGLFYTYHIWKYPPSRQARDAKFLLSSHLIQTVGPLTAWFAKHPPLRGLGQYLLGWFMVSQRATGGNTGFFLGEVSAGGWRTYFPVMYVIKVPLSFHILTLISLLSLAWKIKKPLWKKPFTRILNWIRNHFTEFSMLSFIALYWLTSLSTPLNIGVRHLLPVFPFTMLLVSKGTVDWLKNSDFKLKLAFMALLLIWQAVSVISVYPHFIAYFNELVGGPDRGYIFAVDSNLDWGQDLKRLAKWTEKEGIEKIYVDYFGGSDPEYYLGDKFKPWWGTRNPKQLPPHSYLAVSATFYQGGRGKPVKDFDQPHSYYLWLSPDQMVKKIGYSIFVFYVD